MRRLEYDVITVGGWLGWGAFAKTMADHGARVLVLEREREFSDRVRDEVIWPWDVAELKKLGLFEPLSACARKMPEVAIHIADVTIGQRDPETTIIASFRGRSAFWPSIGSNEICF